MGEDVGRRRRRVQDQHRADRASSAPAGSGRRRSARTASSGVALGMSLVGHAAGRRDHVRRLPADGRRRDRQPAAQVPLHVGRPVHASRSRSGSIGGGDRAVRDPALGHRRELVHAPAGPARRDARRRPAPPTACCAPPSRDDNPVLFFEHKALYGRKGPVDRGDGRARSARPPSSASGTDVTIVATLLMVERALAAAEAARRGGHRAPRSSTCAGCAPSTSPTVAASVAQDRPAGRRRGAGPRRRLGRDGHLASSPSAARSGPRRRDASACPTTTRSRTRRRSRTRSSRRSTASSPPRPRPPAVDRLTQSEAVPPPPDPPRSRAM